MRVVLTEDDVAHLLKGDTRIDPEDLVDLMGQIGAGKIFEVPPDRDVVINGWCVMLATRSSEDEIRIPEPWLEQTGGIDYILGVVVDLSKPGVNLTRMAKPKVFKENALPDFSGLWGLRSDMMTSDPIRLVK